jgi:hypothetical protein
MSSVMLKDKKHATCVEQERECPVRVQQSCRLLQQLQCLMRDWLSSQSSLYSQWHKFKTMSAGPHVIYRVWSRHGAFLEMNGHPHKH